MEATRKLATAPVFDTELDRRVAQEVVADLLARVGGKRASLVITKRIPLLGGGVGALGVSVSQSPGRIQAERRELSLYPEIAGAVARLSVPPAGPAHERRRVLLHVNNLENLSRQSAAAATALFLDLRDKFARYQ